MARRALLTLLVVLASLAGASATLAATAATPTIRSFSPAKAQVGGTLTINGRGFTPGRNRNTVVFMGSGKRVVWVRVRKATRSKLTLTLPTKLYVILDQKGGALRPTRLRLRVISKRSGRSFTRSGKSPLISPKAGATVPGGPGAPGAGGCVANPATRPRTPTTTCCPTSSK